MDLITLIKYMLNLSIFDGNAAYTKSASNAAATVALAAKQATRWHVANVTVAYSDTPTNGLLTVTDTSSVIFQVAIPVAGPVTVQVYRRGGLGAALNITLSAGGSGITGYVNADVLEGK